MEQYFHNPWVVNGLLSSRSKQCEKYLLPCVFVTWHITKYFPVAILFQSCSTLGRFIFNFLYFFYPLIFFLLPHYSLLVTLLLCLVTPLENRFTLTWRSNDFLWHSESSSAVTLLLHADWMMLKNSSSQGEAKSVTLAPWHKKPRLRVLVASKAVFLKNYLAVSTWILNGSSIECLEKKYQPFSFAGVRFGSLVNQISGLKSAWCRSGLCLTLLLCNSCYKWILRNIPRNQTDMLDSMSL